MHAGAERRLTRRLADRVDCLRRGHAWETTEFTCGEVSMLRTDCARCGRIGPLHGAEHRSVNATGRAAVG